MIVVQAVSLSPSVIGARPGPALPGAVPLTSRIGRAQEIGRVRALLRRTDVRLVTLTGPGGVGKTRLALGIAGTVGEDYADGAVVVGLASTLDPALVLPEIAQAMGMPPATPRAIDEHLQEMIGTKHLLLVLDNFEQALPAGPRLAALLASCPNVTLLMTSRAPLRVSGEREFAVPPPSPTLTGMASPSTERYP